MSFSTTYMERGDHSGTDGKIEGTQTDALRARSTLDYRKTVPLLKRKHAARAQRDFEHLPSFHALPVLSLHHQRVASLEALEEVGHAFVKGRAAAGARRLRNGGRPSALEGDDMRPVTQHPVSRSPSTQEYEALARLWLAG